MGAQWSVSAEVHAEDFIFRFLIDNPGFNSKEKAIEYYFNDGAKSTSKLKSLLEEICKFESPRLELLEFASGYGCITRHAKNIMPEIDWTACDIHEQAIAFIEDKLATKAILSKSDPRQFSTAKKYDVVFALSFFSHMPKSTFTLWLNSLASCLKPGGYLIFTTHGLVSRKYTGDVRFDRDGFYFLADSEQKDLDKAEYGTTVTKPKYVIDRISNDTPLSLKYFQEGCWWGHQDLYVAQFDDEPLKRGILDLLKSKFYVRD